ncbi:MAG: hypothetical protein Q7K42_01790 [Candidatus Diapherotrites archaeon]|nr:hypothetical protein [Candidatus Diapherotrites archaeon]
MKFSKLESKNSERIVNFFNSRFGVETDFFSEFVFLRNNEFIWLANKSLDEVISEDWNFRSAGLMLLLDQKEFKPSHYGMLFLTSKIKQNFVELSPEQAEQFFTGKSFPAEGISLANVLSEGFVAVKFQNQVIGSVFYKSGKFTPNLPIKKRDSKIGIEL